MDSFAERGQIAGGTADARVATRLGEYAPPPSATTLVDMKAQTLRGPIRLAHRGEAVVAVPYDRLLFVELCRSADAAVALVLLGTAFLIANAESRPQNWNDFLLLHLSFSKLLELGLFAFAWQHIFRTFGLYDKHWAPTLREEAPRVLGACSVGVLISVAFAPLSQSGAFRAVISLAAWAPMVAVTLGARVALRKVAERENHTAAKRVLVVGSGPLAHRLFRDLTEGRIAGARDVLGFVDSNLDVRFGEIRNRIVGTLDQLEQLLMHMVVDEVLVALPIKSQYMAIQRVIEVCERAGVQCRYSSELFHAKIASPRVEISGRYPAVAMHTTTADDRLKVKRAMDVAGAALGMALSAPAWVLIALAIKATSRGPVFFAQERYGWRKRRFRMLKFRTMVTDAEALQASLESRNEAGGPVFKISKDPRVTPIGSFLRKTSLDELPQLWNVLRGDMSLVGPRPLPMRDVRLFSEAWLMRRFSVLPGITGLWQVSGRSNLTFEQWMALDLQYIDRWSLSMDIGILLRTIPAVLRGVGAA
jgi:exopolysaccharide biosynthesis polyprenyl glycosylphosphotransferase